MQSHSLFYINGKWAAPATKNEFNLINPATEQHYPNISMGSSADVDAAVQAARHAFKSWRSTSLVERINLLQSLKGNYQKRYEEMGAPISMARDEHTALGLAHIQNFIEEVGKFQFQHTLNDDPGQQIVYSPIGVCGLITPWNWPINQLTLKVIPALATGCCNGCKQGYPNSSERPYSRRCTYLFCRQCPIISNFILDDARSGMDIYNLVIVDGVIANILNFSYSCPIFGSKD